MTKRVLYLTLAIGLTGLALLACRPTPVPPTPTPLPTTAPIPTRLPPTAPPTQTPLPSPTPSPTEMMIQLGDTTCTLAEAEDFVLELSSTLTIIQEAVITADLVPFEDRAQLHDVADGLEFDTAWLFGVDVPRCLRPLVDEMRLAAEQYIALFRATAESEPGEEPDSESLEYLRTAPEHLASAQALMEEALVAIAAAKGEAP